MSSTKTSSWAPAKQALAKVQRGPLRKLRSPKATWPEPKSSVGDLEVTIKESSYWKVTGPAREVWTKIWPEIESYLNAHTEPIAVSSVTWKIRMIGRTPDTSAPTILFLCEDELHRKAACDTIKKSNILDDYKGIRIAHMPRTPGSTRKLVLMSAETHFIPSEPLSNPHMSDPRRGPRATALQSHTNTHSAQDGISDDDSPLGWRERPSQHGGTVYKIPTRNGLPCKVYSNAAKITSGVTLDIENAQGQMSRSTVGGTVLVNGTVYIMTAAHPFTSEEPCNDQPVETENNLIFVDSEDESDELHEESIVSTGTSPHTSYSNSAKSHTLPDVSERHIPTSESSETLDDTLSGPRGLTVTSLFRSDHVIGELCFSSIEQLQPQLDYALIEVRGPSEVNSEHRGLDYNLDHNFDQDAGFTTQEGFQHLRQNSVFSILGSAPEIRTEGTVDANPALIRLPYSEKYQEVYEVKFDRALWKGDCGSWVKDALTGLLHGHIIAGSPDDGIAYIVPYYQVYADMKVNFTVNLREQYRRAPGSWQSANPRVQRILHDPTLQDAIFRLEGRNFPHNRSLSRQPRPTPAQQRVRAHSPDWYHRNSRPLGMSNLRHLNEVRTQMQQSTRHLEEQSNSSYDTNSHVDRRNDYSSHEELGRHRQYGRGAYDEGDSDGYYSDTLY
jgi:hypothetical protein